MPWPSRSYLSILTSPFNQYNQHNQYNQYNQYSSRANPRYEAVATLIDYVSSAALHDPGHRRRKRRH